MVCRLMRMSVVGAASKDFRQHVLSMMLLMLPIIQPSLGSLGIDAIWFGVIFTMTFLVVLLTEEGYFRGVLWGACDRCELGPAQTYWTTSFAFAAWHIYLPFVEPEFAIATWQIPIYLVNVILISFAWGWLRLATGSLWLCCFVHAVWNALVYSVFGAGVATGFSNIESVWIFGPERGCLGIIANGAALWLLSRLVRSPSNNHRRGIISTGDA